MIDAGRTTALLCDAAFSSLPILYALKRRGHRVAVCGSRPEDPGHRLADLSFVMDYADQDLLLNVLTREKIDFLVPGCTDVSYLSCAAVAAQTGLPGYDALETANILHRKDRFREFCRERAFAIPRSTLSLSETEALRFPILIKPSDSFSGKGIVKVDTPSGVPQAVERAQEHSRTQSVVFEEFVDGNLYSHSAFIEHGEIVYDCFVNEYCTVYPYTVNSSHVSIDLDSEIVQGLRTSLERFASELNLADGLIHTQFISDGTTFYLIEVMRRCPGDLYSVLIEKASGVDYPDMYVSAFCNSEIGRMRTGRRLRFISRHTVSVERDCVYFSSSLAVPGTRVSFVPLKRAGEQLRAAPMDRAGIYFSEYRSAEEMKDWTPKLHHCCTVESL